MHMGGLVAGRAQQLSMRCCPETPAAAASKTSPASLACSVSDRHQYQDCCAHRESHGQSQMQARDKGLTATSPSTHWQDVRVRYGVVGGVPHLACNAGLCDAHSISFHPIRRGIYIGNQVFHAGLGNLEGSGPSSVAVPASIIVTLFT